jgi:hypothetical protein
MKTQLIYLFLIIASFSCGTNNKPLSNAQKEKIKGEVKEVVNTIFKASEEVNSDTFLATFLDSPDFIYISNGKIFNYKECVDSTKLESMVLKNQKCLKLDEKYVILNNSTVLYTANSKWLMNLKDGSAIIQDPELLQLLFKKTDSKWKILNFVESGKQQIVVGNENLIKLNQAELLKKFVGNWEKPLGKDTSQLLSIKRSQGGNGVTVYTSVYTKIKPIGVGEGFWAYDVKINKIDISLYIFGEIFHALGEFTSPNKFEFFDVNNTAHKFIYEIIPNNEIRETDLIDNKTEISSYKRTKY